MATEREKIVSEQNYEISKNIYNLFKKYKNYESDIKKVQRVEKYNPDNLFKNNRKQVKQVETKVNTDNVSLVEYKENIFTKILNKIKNIFKRNK